MKVHKKRVVSVSVNFNYYSASDVREVVRFWEDNELQMYRPQYDQLYVLASILTATLNTVLMCSPCIPSFRKPATPSTCCIVAIKESLIIVPLSLKILAGVPSAPKRHYQRVFPHHCSLEFTTTTTTQCPPPPQKTTISTSTTSQDH